MQNKIKKLVLAACLSTILTVLPSDNKTSEPSQSLFSTSAPGNWPPPPTVGNSLA